MSRPICEDITVIIRSASERTEDLCRRLLCEQVPAESISIIHERPFPQALRKALNIGMEHGRPWTLCVDADVLVGKDAVHILKERARSGADNVFEIQGMVLDKFFGGPRPAGNHLYRTSMLGRALNEIPTSDMSLRPETYMIRQMAAKGHAWVQLDTVVGLHDYQQYYRDTYRKAFTHAWKHKRYLPYLRRFWARMAERDADFDVALLAVRAALITEERARLDAQQFDGEVDALLRTAGHTEKEPLLDNGLSSSQIEEIVRTFRAPPEYACCRALMNGLVKPSLAARVRAASRTFGWFRLGPWLLGRTLWHIGRTLCKRMERRRGHVPLWDQDG